MRQCRRTLSACSDVGFGKKYFDVAKTVYQIATGASAITRDRRDRLAALLKDISETLADASATLSREETPHGACAALSQYSNALDQALEGFVTTQRAAELGNTLRSSYEIERLGG